MKILKMSSNNKHDNARRRVQNLLESLEWKHFGFAALTTPVSLAHYDQWLQNGHHGDMQYLQDHRSKKQSLESLLPKAKSLISVAVNYIPHPATSTQRPVQALKVARYARGDDYHFWLQTRLQQTCDQLRSLFPDEQFLCYTDSRPVLERDFASQLGLGWVGKNSCLIHPKRGSFFLLGEIITTQDLGPSLLDPVPDLCGTCRRCIDACPTDAINDNRTLDARRCISYWTIESKHNPPKELSQNFDAWFFGCDICQEVCPWNEKAFSKPTFQSTPASRESLIEVLQWILSSSNKSLIKAFSQSPITRAGGHGLKRNALIVIQNLKIREMSDFLGSWRPERPNLVQLKDETLQVLKL